MSSSRSLFFVILALVSQFSCDANSYVQSGDDFLFGSELLEFRNQLTRALEDPTVMKDLFADFIEKYNKVYLNPAEKTRRFEIFSSNVEKYNELNQNDMGTAVYGIDQFADMTNDEFKEKMLTLDAAALAEDRSLNEIYDDPEPSKKKKIPRNFDWRSKNVVGPVKEQGFCNADWAFSAVCNLEGLWAIKHKKLEDFSEQQILDCDFDSDGCRGGSIMNAYKYVKEAGGLEKSETYPYTAAADVPCVFNKSAVVLTVKSVVELPRDEKKIATYMYLNGPSSVAFNGIALQGYRGGIAHPPESLCSRNETKVNHGAAIVGYGVLKIELQGKKKNMPYWIIKNNWGVRFGQKGYYYLYRGDGSCAIHTYVRSAVLD